MKALTEDNMYLNKINLDRLNLGIYLLKEGKLEEPQRSYVADFLVDLLINRLELDKSYKEKLIID